LIENAIYLYGHSKVRTTKNQELTRLIGRRLKDSLGDSCDGMTAAIQDGLEAVRRAERSASAREHGVVVDIAGNGAADTDSGALMSAGAEASRDNGS
jgi:hypothetical protein